MHRIVDSRCVLAVRDLQASTRFYVDVLGFRRDFGDGSDGWSFLSRDAFKIMLGECPGEKPASELGDHSYVAYLIVEGVDQFHAEVAERGAEVLSQPATEPWGLREFSIRTPDAGIASDSENRPAWTANSDWSCSKPRLTSRTSKASNSFEDEDSAGSQAREVELGRSGA